jgi:Polysaccharide biosynthesis enzyme WcbI
MMSDVFPGLQCTSVLNWEYILCGRQLPESMFSCDALVFQPYAPTDAARRRYSSEEVLGRLRPGTPTVSVPFMTCSSYWPDALPIMQHALQDAFPQRSAVLSCCSSVAEAVRTYGQAHFSVAQLAAHVNADVRHMHDAERGCDVKVASFVTLMMRRSLQLFHSRQHPSNHVLCHALVQVVAKLGLGSPPDDLWRERDELLMEHSVLVLPCVRAFMLGERRLPAVALRLKGDPPGVLVDEVEYVKRYWVHVRRQDDDVASSPR